MIKGINPALWVGITTLLVSGANSVVPFTSGIFFGLFVVWSLFALYATVKGH